MGYTRNFCCLLACWLTFTVNAGLVDTVNKIKPSVVGVGIHTPTGRPKNKIYGSGFVVGDGHYVITNQHVLSSELDKDLLQKIAVFIGSGGDAVVRQAKFIGNSVEYDLAILKVQGPALPALTLGSPRYVGEGSQVAFTGFPIGAVLGLYPVTHRGIVASITPTVVPVADARKINLTMLKRMRRPYMIYQLDATAYPGNSGSALYDVNTGKVIGIVNKVFVQQTKEALLSNPSGITYAIPVKHLRDLLDNFNIKF
jgi:serine protease Do